MSKKLPGQLNNARLLAQAGFLLQPCFRLPRGSNDQAEIPNTNDHLTSHRWRKSRTAGPQTLGVWANPTCTL